MHTIGHFINGQSVTTTGAVNSPVYEPGRCRPVWSTVTPQSWRRLSRSPRRRNPLGPQLTLSAGLG